MSIGQTRPTILPLDTSKEIKLETFTARLKKHRASTTLQSPRPLPQIENRPKNSSQEPVKFPYSGLSIGLMKLNQRNRKRSVAENSPVNYTHFFSDRYFNSETISFPKVEKEEIVEVVSGKKEFLLPAKINFRRLKKRIWDGVKNREEEISGINNFTSRSAGKGYDLNQKNKELLPVTRFRSREEPIVSKGLKVKGVLKTFKDNVHR